MAMPLLWACMLADGDDVPRIEHTPDGRTLIWLDDDRRPEGLRDSGSAAVGREAVAQGELDHGFQTPAVDPSRSRELLVIAEDVEGLPVEGLALRLESNIGPGLWALSRRGVTDGWGRLRMVGLREGEEIRVAALHAGAGAPATVPLGPVMTIVVHRPRSASVRLVSASGQVLTGAHRVAFDAVSAGGAEHIELQRSPRPGRWSLGLVVPVEGTLRVTDSIGQMWSARVFLEPDVERDVSPGDQWIAVARAEFSSQRRAPQPEATRVQWSLRAGDGRLHRGSGWLAPDAGFHAVLERSRARESGGELRLSWAAAQRQHEALCLWHPDPTLEHVELHASPLGEASSRSRRGQ